MRDSSYFFHKLYFTLDTHYKTTALKYRFKSILTIFSNLTLDKQMHVIRIKL